MQITIDTNNLSELDVAMLSFLAENGEVAEETEPEAEAPAAPAKAPAAKKAAAKAEAPAAPAAEPEGEDDDLVGGDGPTMAEAIARATEMVSQGGSAKVKEALASVGAKKVSEMDEDKIPAFFAALDAE